MASPHASFRPRAGLLILIAFAAAGVLGQLGEGVRSLRELPPTDPVTLHEARISRLTAFLPAAGTVGYATTVENEAIFAKEKAFQNVEFLAQYALTQYTLAPRIVRNSPELPLVVGNFLDGPPATGFLVRHGLVPLKDFGEGLVLFQREKAP